MEHSRNPPISHSINLLTAPLYETSLKGVSAHTMIPNRELCLKKQNTILQITRTSWKQETQGHSLEHQQS